MADPASVIKSYFLELGWQIDEKSFRNYARSLKDTDNSVLAVGASLAAAGSAALIFTERMADSMEKLYFATRRTGTTAAEFQGFGLAMQNAGGSAEGAAAALETLSSKMRSTYGFKSWLEAHGVSPKDLDNSKKSMDDLRVHWLRLKEAGQYPQAVVEAQFAVGMSEKDLNAFLSKDYEDETARIQRAQDMFGLGPDALKKAQEFEKQLGEMETVFGAFKQWIENDLNGPMQDFLKWTDHALTSLQDFIKLAQTSGLATALKQQGVPDSIANFLGTDQNNPAAVAAEHKSIENDLTQAGVIAPETEGSTIVGRWLKALGHSFSSLGQGLYAETVTAPRGWNDPTANQNADSTYNLLRKLGIPDTQAQAMTGVAWMESGGTFDPHKLNSAGGGRGAQGIFQVRGSRIDDYIQMYGHDPLHGTTEEQAAFAAYEVLKGKEHHNAGTFFSATDPYSAGYIFERDIQRPDSEPANRAAGADARHVANVTVHIHGNADEHAVRRGVSGGLSDAYLSRNFSF